MWGPGRHREEVIQVKIKLALAALATAALAAAGVTAAGASVTPAAYHAPAHVVADSNTYYHG
jgi:hypothetical protein